MKKKIYPPTWVKLLKRMLSVDTPESRLIAYFLALELDAECAAQIKALQAGTVRSLFVDPFWQTGFRAYALAIGLEPDQLLGMGRQFVVASTQTVSVPGLSGPVMLSPAYLVDASLADVRALHRQIKQGALAPASLVAAAAASKKGGAHVAP